MDYTTNWRDGEHPGWWYWTVERHEQDGKDWIIRYCGIVDWITENLDGAAKHARWTIDPEYAYFKFRYERDYLIFTLRWS